MATIKPIEASSVHRIQSGQVIVDLCSVVKELVENSLDAGATSIDIRFRSQGLESIEVQDNGSGIPKDDYDSIALKHHTSKLRSYADLTALHTYGFRGEALSALCALSTFTLTTCQVHEAPQGSHLSFAASGALLPEETRVVAAQRGTTVTVAGLFKSLPVRRQELDRNIKREYGKVLALLQAYACGCAGVRLGVSNVMGKRRSVVFATDGKGGVRENIANVFGARAVAGLVPVDLAFSMEASGAGRSGDDGFRGVRVEGYVSRPVVGEGRQAPDRQMFFVNGRPCALPQIAKVVNEIYRSYNMSQSPFVLANVLLDTNAYDVNVSPDKRTFLLHDQAQLLDSLRKALSELFENQQQTVPQSQRTVQKLPAYRPLSLSRQVSLDISTYRSQSARRSESLPQETSPDPGEDDMKNGRSGNASGDDEEADAAEEKSPMADTQQPTDLIRQSAERNVSARVSPPRKPSDFSGDTGAGPSAGEKKLLQRLAHAGTGTEATEQQEDSTPAMGPPSPSQSPGPLRGDAAHVAAFNARLAFQAAARGPTVPSEPPKESQQSSPEAQDAPEDNGNAQSARQASPEALIPSLSSSPHPRPTPGVLPSAFNRMRPLRATGVTPAMATVTIGNQTTTAPLGLMGALGSGSRRAEPSTGKRKREGAKERFGLSLRGFAAPGTQLSSRGSVQEEDKDDDIEDSSGGEEDEEEEGEGETQNSNQEREREHAYRVVDEEELEVHIEQPTSADPDTTSSQSPSLRKRFRTQGLHTAAADNSLDANEATPSPTGPTDPDGGSDSDGEYLDEIAKKVREDARVAKLIHEAEARAAVPSEERTRHAQQVLKAGHRDTTTRLSQTVDMSLTEIARLQRRLDQAVERSAVHRPHGHGERPQAKADKSGTDVPAAAAEAKLALTVSKADFARMRIVGQFNLGFIVAVRPAAARMRLSNDPLDGDLDDDESNDQSMGLADELFIIDQHASDEKYNFERLARTTVLRHQRLAVPHRLELSAVEEELAEAHQDVLLKNGFVVELDHGATEVDAADDDDRYMQAVSIGDDASTEALRPAQRRAMLHALPMSREATFSPRDLEELLALLGDSQTTSLAGTDYATAAPSHSGHGSALPASSTAAAGSAVADGPIVRPSKVRRLLAMRACRSSVMIGRTLTRGQMARLVRNMGTIERPWNCPHGRPTMRHVAGLDGWASWQEGTGVRGMRDSGGDAASEDEDEEGTSWGETKGVWAARDGAVDWEGWLESVELEDSEDDVGDGSGGGEQDEAGSEEGDEDSDGERGQMSDQGTRA